jgi:hypothetical protein
MDELQSLLKTIRGVSKPNPVTYMQLSEMIRKLWRDKEGINVKWHPDGILFSEDEVNPNIISYTAGKICIHLWNKLSPAQIVAIGPENYHPERWWTVEMDTITLPSDAIYYIFAKVPIDEEVTTATLVFDAVYHYEEFYPGYINILMGVISEPCPDRIFSNLWNGIIYIPRALPPRVTRWIERGDTYCESIGGYSTGMLVVITKEQFRTGADNWQDTVPEKLNQYLVDSEGFCPTLLFGVWVSVGPIYNIYNTSNEEKLIYDGTQDNVKIRANSLMQTGTNYLFYSIPEHKTLKVFDADDKDITEHFGIISSQSRGGYHANTIYRLDAPFETTIPVTFKIILT